MRLMVLLARWRWGRSDRRGAPTPARRRWLRSPWLWCAVLVLLGLALQSPPQTPAAARLPARTGLGPLLVLRPAVPATPQASSCGVTDLTSCINDWVNSFTKDTIGAWFKQQVGIFEGYGFIWGTPDSLTYHAQPVQEAYHFMLGVVSVFLTFILAVAGFNHMTGRSTVWADILQQVIFCTVIAWFFQPFLGVFIDLGNDYIYGLNAAVGAAPTFPEYGAVSDALMDIIAFIFELLGDLLLAVELLMRLALLDLLIALSPVGIICYVLPQTRAWGKMWAEALAATIIMQPIQVTIIMLGAKMLSLLAGFLTVPSLPPIVEILVGITSIALSLYVPRFLLTRATSVVSDFHAEATRAAARMITATAA